MAAPARPIVPLPASSSSTSTSAAAASLQQRMHAMKSAGDQSNALIHPATGSSMSSSGSSSGTNGAEFQEIKSITLHWHLANLKTIFSESRGDTKSRCIKSNLFGDGQWEIFFYAQSGGDYVSLYLSAESTAEERDRGARNASGSRSAAGQSAAPSSSSSSNNLQAQGSHTNAQTGAWYRDGSYRFVFEIRPLGKAERAIKSMEAERHVFSSEARNWGWQSFARRNDVYYNNALVKHHDAFIIVCTITYAPFVPAPSPLNYQRKMIPAELLTAFSGMFNDPNYSDVEFVVKSRSTRTGRRKQRSLFAIKRILVARAEYFSTMFSSGFSESGRFLSGGGSSFLTGTDERHHHNYGDAASSGSSGEDSDEDGMLGWSDREDLDSLFGDGDEAMQVERHPEARGAAAGTQADGDDHNASAAQSATTTSTAVIRGDAASGVEDEREDIATDDEADDEEHQEDQEEEEEDDDEHTAHTSFSAVAPSQHNPPQGGTPSRRNRQSRPQSVSATNLATPTVALLPPQRQPTTMRSASTHMSRAVSGSDAAQREPGSPASPRTVIEVKDCSYSTYKALLYFLYTDAITFAPLSSTYYHARDTAQSLSNPFPFESRHTFMKLYFPQIFNREGADRDLVASAKAIYRLADKLNIPVLKTRAFEHIVKSLTADTLPYEAFSAFSFQFSEVRKVQVDLLLANWATIRQGQAMRNIFRLVRQDPDRFPAFSEVFGSLILSLEYRAPTLVPLAQAEHECGKHDASSS